MSIFSKPCAHKYGRVDLKSGLQYCSLCGVANKVECSHRWQLQETLIVSSIITHQETNKVYVKECSNCGEMKSFKFGVNNQLTLL